MQPNHRTLYRLSTVNDTMNGDFFGSVVNPEVLRCCSDGPQTHNSLPRCSLNFLCLQTHPVCFHSASWFGLSSVPVGLYFGPNFSHPGHFVIDGGIQKSNDPRSELRYKEGLLDPDSIAESYLHVFDQKRNAWTWEMELRPWIENF